MTEARIFYDESRPGGKRWEVWVPDEQYPPYKKCEQALGTKAAAEQYCKGKGYRFLSPFDPL